MAFETTSSYASSCLQSNDAPKELLELLGILNKKQQEQQLLQQYEHQQQHPQHSHSHKVNLEEDEQQQQQQQQEQELQPQQLQQYQTQQQQQKHYVELSQIELIYRAEGNANLVLALPQFKKVLRLPKIQQKRQTQQQQQPQQQLQLKQQEPQYQETQCSNQKHANQNKQQLQQQQHEMKQQEPTNMILNTNGQQQQQQQHNQNAVGILTMDHYVAYIGIIRCLLGNEFVFEADIVAVPNPNDRDWINEHIRPARPVNRLDKEFGGHYGLLLPDATRLPTEFDILFSNLQHTKSTMAATDTKTTTSTSTTTAAQQSCCNRDDVIGNNNIFAEDTYAIEIKPKQGWLLPNNVNNLFDIRPKTTVPAPAAAPTATATQNVIVATSAEMVASTATSNEEALKASGDKKYFTATQLKPSAAVATATKTTVLSTSVPATFTSTSRASLGDDKISQPLHSERDIRCRYCSMQFLKLQQQKIMQRNNYCPIDLFSGVPERMLNALHALFICPQNNLRIFKNGLLVYDDQLSRMSRIEDLFPSDKLQLIKHLLIACLLKDYKSKKDNDITTTANEDAHGVSVDDDYDDDDDDDDDDPVDAAKALKVIIKEAKATKRDDVQLPAVIANESLAKPYEEVPHSNMLPCKKRKHNIDFATKAETEVTKVTTTFTNASLLATPSSSTNIASCAKAEHTSPYICSCRSGGSGVVGGGDGDHASIAKSDVSVGQMNIPEMLSLPKNCILQKILHLQLLAKLNFPHMQEHNYENNKQKSYKHLMELLGKFKEFGHELEISKLNAVEQYLLAATALDCSIMITFRQIPSGQNRKSFIENSHMICVNGSHFITKTTLLDLDPKPDTHFAKYCKQTREIAEILQV